MPRDFVFLHMITLWQGDQKMGIVLHLLRQIKNDCCFPQWGQPKFVLWL